MATLKELCSNIPTQISRQAAEYEVLRRQVASYRRRVDALRTEENVFGKCRQSRPEKGKYKNRYSAEEAGTQGAITAGIRVGKYTVVVCKSQKFN